MLGSSVAPYPKGFPDHLSSYAPNATNAPESKQLQLKVISGDDVYTSRTVTLPSTIGRPTGSSGLTPSSHNSLFANSLISRKHARLYCEGSAMWIADLGSSNGTYLNGVLLKANTPYRLNEGDLLQFGADDDFEVGSKQQQLVVLQVKLNGNAVANKNFGLAAPMRTFSPGRILQEARSMLSKSSIKLGTSTSSYDIPSLYPSAARLPTSFSHHNPFQPDNRAAVLEASSELIALAQRLVEAAEAAKMDSLAGPDHLRDLNGSVEHALRLYNGRKWIDTAEATIYSRPNFPDALRLVCGFEREGCTRARMITITGLEGPRPCFSCSRAEGDELWSMGFYGGRPGEMAYILSSHEALYLAQHHNLQVRTDQGPLVSCQDLSDRLTSIDASFPSKHTVYQRLRQSGWVVRSGLNYGTDFVLYESSPDKEHAEYAVLVLDEEDEADRRIRWRRLLGINRSCVGAKKKLLVAIVKGEAVRLVEVERWQPEAERTSKT